MPATDDLDPPTVADVTTPAPVRRQADREELIGELAEISTQAAIGVATGETVEDLRNTLVRVWKTADAAIRRARGM